MSKPFKHNMIDIVKKENTQPISYPDDGNTLCFTLEDKSQWFKHRNDVILYFLNKYGNSGDFLDIGGGNGFQCLNIKNSGYKGKVILCEPGIKGCENAKKRGIEYIYNLLFQDFPFEEFSIKNIGLFDVIEHVENDIEFLNNLYHKISIGTKIFISVPAFNSPWSQTDKYSGHYRRYNLTDLNRLSSNTKFKIIDYTYYFNYYIIPLFILRVLPYRLGIRYNEEQLKQKEQKNHNNKHSFLEKLFDKAHHYSLNQLRLNKKIKIGTSLFIILEK